MHHKDQFTKRVGHFIGSRRFFYAALVLFGAQASSIAAFSKYPMAYDESYHLGIIQLYSTKWLPFFGKQPAHASGLGPLTVYPSYLYHYLMSFPYRAFHAITPSIAANVIFLRFIDILFFAIGFWVFRKVLLEMKLPAALAHAVLFCIMLLPVVTFLAANINYDSLEFMLLAYAMLLTVRIVQQITAGSVSLKALCWLITTCCFASLTMYSFLPIFVGIVVCLSLLAVLHRKTLAVNYFRIAGLRTFAMLALLVLGVGLFTYRYGVNVIRYHSPDPQCNQVLSVSYCEGYGVWARNYALAEKPHPAMSPGRFVLFNRVWATQLLSGLFSVVSTQGGGMVMPPIHVLADAAFAVAAVGTLAALIYRRELLRRYGTLLAVVLIIGAGYLLALWIQNYMDFTHLGTFVAIQSRYLVPVLPMATLIPALGIREVIKHRPTAVSAMSFSVICLFLLCGGVVTYAVRSSPSWYWPHVRYSSARVDSLAKKLT